MLLFFALFCAESLSQTKRDSLPNVQNIDSTTFVMQKSPWGSVLRSAIIPGWGQLYNESYWKIPIVWGGLSYFAYIWVRTDDKYKKYSDLYSQSNYNNSYYKRNRDFYRDQRDTFAIYFALAYLLNLVDAYVDAHLFDFDVSENPMNNSYQLNMRIKF